MSAHRISKTRRIPMKHKKQSKQTLSIKVQIRNGRFSMELSLPIRWLIALATIVSALLSSTPVVQLFEIISRLCA
jgi:hypothetical protein